MELVQFLFALHELLFSFRNLLALAIQCLAPTIQIGFASRQPSVLLVAGLWCVSRTAMATAAMVVPYARAEGGLASAFLGPRRANVARVWLLPAGGAVIGAWLAGPLPVLFAVAAAGVVVAFAFRRIGGFTGDVLGAAGVIAETVGLLVAATRW